MYTHLKKHCNRDLSPPCRDLRYRGVGKRACSPGFLEEFFSETRIVPRETLLHTWIDIHLGAGEITPPSATDERGLADLLVLRLTRQKRNHLRSDDPESSLGLTLQPVHQQADKSKQSQMKAVKP